MYVRKKGNTVVLIVVILFAILSSVLFVRADTPLFDCGVLSTAGEKYALSNSVTSSSTQGTCFHITNSHITLDCRGFQITYSAGSLNNGVGINNTGWVSDIGGDPLGNHNVTIKNCVIFDDSSGTLTIRYGIHFLNAENGTIENNIINTSHASSHGIVFDSSHRNYLFNNSIQLKIPVKDILGLVYSYGIVINGSSEMNRLVNTNFTNASTDSIYHTSIKPTTLKYNNSQASIEWIKTNISTSANLSIGLNVFLDNGLAGYYSQFRSTALLYPDNLNSSAQIQLRNLSYQKVPRIFKWGMPQMLGAVIM